MKLNIHRKLLIFILPIVCFSIFGVGYYGYFIAREETVKQIKSQIQRQAEDAAAEIARLYNQARIDLITISELTSIADYYSNREYELYDEAEVCRKAVERFMLRFSDRSKVYAGVSYIDENGIEIAKIVSNRIAPRYKNRRNELYSRETRGLKKGESYVYSVSVAENGKALIVRHVAPVFNDLGEFKGIVTLNLDFNKIQDLIERMKIGKTSYAFLINQEKLILAHPESKQIFAPIGAPELDKVAEKMIAGNKGWAVASTREGDFLIGYAQVGVMGYSVGVTAPYSDFMDKINRIRINSALTLLFIALIAIFGILFIARGISKPIKELVNHTRMLSDGKFDQQIHVNSADETGELAESFNEMAGKLKSSKEEIEQWNKKLENKVEIATLKLRTEKDKLEAVFRSMADGVIVIDEYSRVIDLNPVAEKFVGAPKSVLIGEQILMGQTAPEALPIKNLQIICEPKFEDRYVRCWNFFNCRKKDCPAHQSDEFRCWLLPQTQCCHSDNLEEDFEAKTDRCQRCDLLIQVREKYKCENQTVQRDITLNMPGRDIRILKTPMFDNQNRFTGNIMVLHDITKEKELDRMKSEFIATVSHELRTPLSSIRSFSELLLDDIGTMDIETQKRFLGIITEESERLTRLISDLLDLQKMQSEKMVFDMEQIQISQIIEKCIQSFSELAKKKDMNVCYECRGILPLVYGDRDKLYQVLSNLLSNAIKFSEEKGQIKVDAEEVQNGVLVSVSDKGIEIPEDKREKVFEKFYQLIDSSVKARTGTGLGLAIARQIVERHGGRIWVDSEFEEGSKLNFVIPKASVDGVPVSV